MSPLLRVNLPRRLFGRLVSTSLKGRDDWLPDQRRDAEILPANPEPSDECLLTEWI